MFEVMKQLSEWEIEEATRFYAEACKNVPYFQEMFGKEDVSQEIYVNFKPDVAAAVRQGSCFGLYHKGVLRSILLSIDWYGYKYDHPVLFEHMFNSELESTKAIDAFINNGEGTIFIFVIATTPSCQKQGYATKLLKKFNSMLKEGVQVVSDCTGEGFDSLWEHNGYKIVDVENHDTLKLAVKEI